MRVRAALVLPAYCQLYNGSPDIFPKQELRFSVGVLGVII